MISDMIKPIIYTTSTCKYCVLAKAFMKQNGVEYEEKNVGEDRVALNEMLEKSGQMGVPVIDIDNKIIVGFDPNKIAEYLNIENNLI